MLDSATELRLTKLLATLVEFKASDLHLTVANPPCLRVGGVLQPLAGEELLTADFIQALVQSLFTPEQVQQFAVKKDLITAINFKGKARYTLHAYVQQGQTSLTFRYIMPSIQPISRWTVHEAVKKCLTIEHGLIMICGEYGAGKSSVLAAFIEEYNQTKAQHIMTFEEPIEYVFTDVKAIIEQVEIGRDLPDVESALQRVQQEDVDVIAIRTQLDAATIRTIMQFLEMGKLVLLEVLAPTIAAGLQSLLNAFQATEQGTLREVLGTTLEAAIALRSTSTGGQPALTCEVLRKSTATINFMKHESFDKVPMLLENGRAEGMITFEQSIT